MIHTPGKPIGQAARVIFGMAVLASVAAGPIAVRATAQSDALAPAPAQEGELWRDAWGQPKSFGLAVAGTLLSNAVPWAYNELIPSRAELKISQISPRSWWNNLKHGFSWDDNNFSVNQFAHPFQGNMYFNSARGAGFNYWTSFLFATAGSFMWECCGETHRMSINDWYNTSIGGAAVGEMLYRTSSMVLDNTATGSERVWREIGAFLMAPTRGFSRLAEGNASRVYANPTHPNDRIPNRLENILSVGARLTGDGRISEETKTNGFLRLQLVSGSLYDLDRQKPFDYFTFGLQVNTRQEDGLGLLTIRGNLWYKDLTTSESVVSKLAVVQDFDYENNDAYEFGGQGVSLMYIQNRRFSERTALEWNVAGTFMPMAAVKSELAFLAEVEGIREGLRSYDFGSGLGARASMNWLRDGYRWLEAQYRVQYLNTLNGSNGNGGDANHVIQMLALRAFIPLGFRRFGVGAEYSIFLRDSFFEQGDRFADIRERTPQWHFFLTWNPTRNTN